MAGTFTFCPNGQVPETLPPDPVQGISMNGWNFASKPAVPYQRKFRITLHGLRWYLLGNGLYDEATDVTHNARLLEKFYQEHGTWDTFTYNHPHLGALTCRFSSAVTIPAAIANSGGLIDAFEITLVHHDPGF